MTSQETFQNAIRESLKLHGQNKWGNKHSEHVMACMMASETGAEVKDILESENFKLAAKVINPSAFAQWMENHVEGFKRETKGEKVKKILSDFTL